MDYYLLDALNSEIKELIKNDMNDDIKEIVVNVRAKIFGINNTYNWHYMACKICQKKLEDQDGIHECNVCNCKSEKTNKDSNTLEGPNENKDTILMLEKIRVRTAVHGIHLKERNSVMLLRNLNQTEGLCNITKLIVIRLNKWSIRADIISGTNIGENFTIPRFIMSPIELKWPLNQSRAQLPVAPCFAHGQLYVALTRKTTRKGLGILNNDDDQ